MQQVDDMTKQLKTNNMKLKGLVTQVSSLLSPNNQNLPPIMIFDF